MVTMVTRTLLTFALAIAFTASVRAASSGNPAQDVLAGRSPKEQAAALGHVAGCSGVSAFFRGIGTQPGIGKGHAFWTVKCSDGKSYLVDIAPDEKGSTRVLECDIVKALHDDCYKKFPK